jgi:hypothetical protein
MVTIPSLFKQPTFVVTQNVLHPLPLILIYTVRERRFNSFAQISFIPSLKERPPNPAMHYKAPSLLVVFVPYQSTPLPALLYLFLRFNASHCLIILSPICQTTLDVCHTSLVNAFTPHDLILSSVDFLYQYTIMCYNIHSTTVFRACMHSHTKVQKDVDCYQADCRRSAAHNRANCRLCARDPESCRTKRLYVFTYTCFAFSPVL